MNNQSLPASSPSSSLVGRDTDQVNQRIRWLFTQGAWWGEEGKDPIVAQFLSVGAPVLCIGLLIAWNGRLALSLLMGGGVMLVAQLWQSHQDSGRRTQVQRWLSILQNPVVLAVSSGVGVTLLTYLATSVWMESAQHWLALELLIQGVMIMAVLSLMIGNRVQMQRFQRQTTLEQALSDIASTSSLKRLAGLYQIRSLLKNGSDVEDRQLITSYLKIALEQETELAVRNAFIETVEMMVMTQAS